MKLIGVLTHRRDRSQGLLAHTAVVEVEDYNPKTDKEALVEAVSIKVGYHPLGYGVYGLTTVAPYKGDEKENRYYVCWRTGTHCD
jgi:hypothetical protein